LGLHPVTDDPVRAIPIPGPWRYFAIHPETRALRGGWVHAQHYRALLDELSSFNLYLHLNPSTGNHIRPRSGEVLGWQAILIDLDPPEREPFHDEILRVHEGITRAVIDLFGIFVQPALVDTGRGAHWWITFPTVTPPPTWAPAGMRGFLRALVKHPAIAPWADLVDFSNTDLPRLARAPGSINHRNGRVARTLLTGFPRAAVVPRLEQFVPVQKETARKIPLDASDWAAYLPRVTWGAANYLTLGAENGGRHDGACKAAYSLRREGCPEREVIKALFWGNSISSDPLDEFEVHRIVETTRRSVS
jgi:hypothetical protein